MRRVPFIAFAFIVAAGWTLAGQRAGLPLTVDSIMRGPKLVGTAPTAIRWSIDSSRLYFTWQPAADTRSGTWTASRDGSGLRKLSVDEARAITDELPVGEWNRARTRVLTAQDGDIVIIDVAAGTRRAITRTSADESSPHWARNDAAVTFVRDNNLYLTSIDATGPVLVQLTDIAPGESEAGEPVADRGTPAAGAGGETPSQRILREEQLALIAQLKRQEAERESGRGGAARAPASPHFAHLALTARQRVTDLRLSSDETFVWVGIEEQPAVSARNQDVPDYVTSSAYPEMISGRPNVGDARAQRRLAILELESGATVWPHLTGLGADYGAASALSPKIRSVDWSMPDVSPDGSHAVVAVRAKDNKDRWLVTVAPSTGACTILDRLHDDAWIRELPMHDSGSDDDPGIDWLADGHRFLFLSEKSGWMHLYVKDAALPDGDPRALTSGTWEVTDARLVGDRETVLLTTNEVHPGERQISTLDVQSARTTRITTAAGAHDATPSPDGRTLAIVSSYTVRPPELFVMPLAGASSPTQITTSPTDEWRSFKWIDPKVITYRARDGAEVHARLFTPEMIGAKRDPRKPGVVFVHGAGYLQEANRIWSAYYRENMFNNLLASRGYVVISPDYRGSAGYGRDWRTAIYRHMGGKDLDDVVDASRFLVQTEHVDAKRVGVYGGSYGGFLTLMAMFTTPDVFAAGAALRPVSDWLHYNHEYTSNILNVPQNDLEAFRRSSPIYFADGLKGRLLILHGMADTNVFFQDSVRLVQRLIELRKENWSIEPYPVENHTFTEETSWADEYRRILAMFEETLRRGTEK
jgi:dipeptidyl aminopeptidase/acylaminoacyl peptidase